MQNVAVWGGGAILSMRGIRMYEVRYWYGICDVQVPFFRAL